MKNELSWKESKFRIGKKGVKPSTSLSYLNAFVISSFISDFINHSLTKHLKGKSILELGCGKCPIFPVIKQHAESYLTVDWVNTQHNLNHVDISHDLNKPLILEDKYDAVLAFDVLEHVYNIDVLISSMQKNIIENGTAIVGVPFLYWLHEVPFDNCRYTHYFLEAKFHELGFKEIEITMYGGGVSVIFDILLKKAPSYLKYFIIFLYLTYVKLPGISLKKPTLFPIYYVIIAKKMSSKQ